MIAVRRKSACVKYLRIIQPFYICLQHFPSFLRVFPHALFVSIYIIPARPTLAAIPAKVDKSAPASVYLVFVTFAARKYTLMV